MKYGIVVDGDAEFHAFPKILPRIQSPNVILAPIKADIQPKAPPGQIVRALKTRIPILRTRGAESIIVLLDREDRSECPGKWAEVVQALTAKECADMVNGSLFVVLKNRKFENWLVADVHALRKMPKRFKFTDAIEKRIEVDKADSIDAYKLLSTTAINESYDKVSDAVKIMNHADPLRIAQNSRSFRRLLRVLEVGVYTSQSKTAVRMR